MTEQSEPEQESDTRADWAAEGFDGIVLVWAEKPG